MSAHIILISPETDEMTQLGEWTSEWFETNLSEEHSLLFWVTTLSNALHAVSTPVQAGTPPTLIIADHGLSATEMPLLISKLRSMIPESWLVELVYPETKIPAASDTVAIQHPVQKEEWFQLLQHMMVQSRTPQWSRAKLQEIGF